MKNMKREDPKKIREIENIRHQCIKKGLDDHQTFDAQHRIISDGTKREHCRATYPLLKNNRIGESMKLYLSKIKDFNKNVKNPDDKIIGVENKKRDIQTGNEICFYFQQIGYGDAAIKNAQLSDARIEGDKQRKKELIRIGKDVKITRSHESKKRKLKTLLGVS